MPTLVKMFVKFSVFWHSTLLGEKNVHRAKSFSRSLLTSALSSFIRICSHLKYSHLYAKSFIRDGIYKYFSRENPPRHRVSFIRVDHIIFTQHINKFVINEIHLMTQISKQFYWIPFQWRILLVKFNYNFTKNA